MALRVLVLALILLVSSASRSDADHECFIVGEMRNVDAIDAEADTIISTSGACIPSHDRERFDCYFTSFGLSKAQTAADLKRQRDELAELQKAPAALTPEQVAQLKASFCTDEKLRLLDPLLKYDVIARSMRTFCERPTRDAALALFRTMAEVDAKKCRCVVVDWRSTLVRQVDRWVENSGPSGRCGVVSVLTLVPYDLANIKTPTGPFWWTLRQKVVTTHRPEDKLCAKGLFGFHELRDRTITVSWNAPRRSIDCGEISFTSRLEGMIDPRRP